MRSITKIELQYAHRFYGFKGEAQYLHGHTGVLTIDDNGVIFVENEAEGIVEPHLALSALDLHNQVVTIKVERKEEEEILDYTDLV